MRRRVAVAVALPVAAAGAIAAVVAVGGGAAQPSTASGGGGGAHGTEAVARRTLVERELVDGTLGYGDARPALDRVGGTLTWLPEAGAVIRPGERLFAVDDLPVVLMDGTVPAWRTLEAGMSDGSDVLQLERNLAALGHDPGTVDDEFTSATAAAVERWQDANGLPETGRVELGRVVFLPGPRRIASVTGTLGSSGGAGGGGASDVAWDGGGAGARTAGWDEPAPAARNASWDGGARFVPIADGGGATTPSTTTPTATAPATTPTTPTTTPTTPSTTPTTPDESPPTQTTPSDGGDRPSGGRGRGDGGGRSGAPDGGGDGEGDGSESPRSGGPSPGGGSPVGGGSGSPGASDGGAGGGDGGAGGGGAGVEVLETTSTERVVTAELDAADQALARVGRAATVTLPSGRTVRGRIVEVGTVATASGDDQGGGAGGGDGSATLPVTIRLRSARGAGGLDEAPVSVALARITRRNVLAVPVQALVARSGGGYAVRVARAGATGGSAEVPVEPGLYADGWVELLDGGVRPGDRVEVPR